MSRLPQRSRVLELLDYDSASGAFIWRVPRKRNQVKAGSAAGSIVANGYLVIGVDGARVYAHRLAWLIVYGDWPTAGVDHVNGNKADNAIRNLRAATQLENGQNLKRPSHNTSGVTGVSWHRQIGRWFAYVTVEGKRHSAGCHGSIEEAAAARRALKARLHAFHPHEVVR